MVVYHITPGAAGGRGKLPGHDISHFGTNLTSGLYKSRPAGLSVPTGVAWAEVAAKTARERT